MSRETWCTADVDGREMTPDAAAGILRAYAETLENGPEEKRYNISLDIYEND